ncbi:YcxB family protein [Chryseobacterium hagamense]|uniref:YcxB-like C-terminal domain-containing protein n=1 Tax=Chryseobacterium hagamense TaxID=395935 RepID=A0A511YMP1_9FLAO|nr:YcxB family protein [Chryseobacterium hagamense]GEN76473.1 hypothetical protein CHA01nite_22130 [Chryseobacterium hagamense]
MTVKTQITFKDFLMFHLKSSFPRLMAFLLILMLAFILKESVDGNTENTLLQSVPVWSGILLVFMVIRSFFSIRFAFNSNKNIQERIDYTFTEETIRARGETFEEEFTWNSVYKVKENKGWFLIYQNAQVMSMVPKKFFAKEQVSGLRTIIKANQVKAKLRKD